MYFEIIDKLIAKCLKKLVDWQDNQRIKDIKKCLLMEYSIEDQRRLDRRDARAEGIEIGKRMKIRTEEKRWKEDGREIYRISLIMKKVEKDQSLEQIADALESSPETLEPIYSTVLSAIPDYNDAEKIYDFVKSKRKESAQKQVSEKRRT